MGEVKQGFYFVTSPPTIARGLAIIGGWVMDNVEVNEPSGVIRAFDVLTGKFAWAWDMGRPGVNTEPADGESYTRGTPNMWSMTSYDDQLGLIYAPLGNATPDYFGGHRTPRSEQYASSVVALDVTNGSVRWHFQTVHHDIWDYDVPSQPALVDLPQADGTVIPALVQGTKRGELFVLDRRDGKPIAPVEEQPVPQGAVERRLHRENAAILCRHAALPRRLVGSGHVGYHAVRSDVVPHRVQEASLRGTLHAAVNGRNDPIPRECRRLQLGKRRDRRGSAAARRESTHHGQPADPLST